MAWEDPEDDESTTSVASALANPRGESGDKDYEVPDAEDQQHSPSTQEQQQASTSNPDSGISDYTEQDEEKDAQPSGDGADAGMAQFMGSEAGGEDPYKDFNPVAPQVPTAPTLPDASAERDELAHSIANFDPSKYKPSQGRRVGAAIASGMAAFGHMPGAETMAQRIYDAPLNQAKAQEQQKETALNQAIRNKEQQRADAQQNFGNQVQQYNLQERDMTNQARIADWKALADQRKAAAQAKLSTVDKNTLGPVDPNNPYGEWQGRTPNGQVVRGLEPPAAVQKDPRYVMQQRRNDVSEMQKMGLRLTQREIAHYLAGDKTFGDPTEHTTVSIRENPDGSPVQPRGRGPQEPDANVSAIVAKSIRDKDAFVNKYTRNQDGTYSDVDNPAQGLTGEEFTSKVDKFRTDANTKLAKYGKVMDASGNIVDAPTGSGGTPESPAGPAPSSGPQKNQQQAPTIKQGGGKQLTDRALAKQYLAKAGGDKEKARQLAAKDGWKF